MIIPFREGEIEAKYGHGSEYHTAQARLGRVSANESRGFGLFFASVAFYASMLYCPLYWLCARAARGRCDDAAWVYASNRVSDLMEDFGCPLSVEGLENINPAQPCVYVANHMSTLETFMLPGIIRPRQAVTFVVKSSLCTMPFFGAVMRSRDPITVERKNPRDDLAAVLDGGLERLKKGVSIIIFPQSTRSATFDPKHFNSIGAKLARHADVPLVPIALKTDAWGTGKKIKELGPIRKGRPVRYRFGQAMRVTGTGREEHAKASAFIADSLAQWQKEDQGLTI